MIFFRMVRGESMSPNYRDGDVVMAKVKDISVGDVVVARVEDREVLKRVVAISGRGVEVCGDNPDQSTDSRHYGLLSRSDILGVIMIHLPVSQPPVPLRYKYGTYMGWGAAALLLVFSLLQLFRIDNFVPEMTRVLPGDYMTGAIITVVVLTMQVFALPFLMRMRLSPLASILSGLFGVFVPLFWVLVSIWNFSSGLAVPQFGEFGGTGAIGWLLFGNILWLVYAYLALWALGFDKAYSPILERLTKKQPTKKSKVKK